MTATAPAPKRAGRPLRRDVILDAAAELFAQRGFAATGIDEIGVAAGITGPGVYRHFASKDDLLETLIQRSIEQLFQQDEEQASDETPDATIDRLARSLVSTTVRSSALACVLWYEWGNFSDEVQNLLAHLHRLRVIEWVHALGRLGLRRTDAELTSMVDCVYGMVIEAARVAGGMEPGHVEDLLVAAVRDALGVRTGPL